MNAVTKKDAYPLPHVEGLLSRLQNTHYITGLDLQDAFWKIPLEEQSREKTAFTVGRWTILSGYVMPFGLFNAAQRICRLIDKVISAPLRENVPVYLDDLMINLKDCQMYI